MLCLPGEQATLVVPPTPPPWAQRKLPSAQTSALSSGSWRPFAFSSSRSTWVTSKHRPKTARILYLPRAASSPTSLPPQMAPPRRQNWWPSFLSSMSSQLLGALQIHSPATLHLLPPQSASAQVTALSCPGRALSGLVSHILTARFSGQFYILDPLRGC